MSGSVPACKIIKTEYVKRRKIGHDCSTDISCCYFCGNVRIDCVGKLNGTLYPWDAAF